MFGRKKKSSGRKAKAPLGYSVRTSGREAVRTRSATKAAKLVASRARAGYSTTVKPVIVKQKPSNRKKK